jgi:hypothetical protein
MQGGLPVPHGEHHAISIEREGVLTSYAVLENDFQECSVEEIGWCLRLWDVADIVRANRVAHVSRDGASSLFV